MSWLDHVRQAGQRTGRGVARLARAVQDAEGGPRVRRRLALALAIAAIAALAWTSVVRIGEAEVGVIVNNATGRLTVADRVGYRFAVSGLRTVHRHDPRVRTPTMADRAGPGDRPAPGRGAVRSFAPGVVAALLAATVCCSGAALLVDPGGGDGGLSPAEEPECRHLGGEAGATPRFLRENAGRYHEAIARARAWLDRLRVDPAELRAAGIKGKKKLVELLDAYVRLHAIVDLEERPEILARAWQVAAVTYTDGYHDMLAISDKHFKQDATSYLRTAYLMEGLGLDTTRFRREIRRIQGRLDGHMRHRGSHQRMAFHWYYGHFGLKEPFDLAAGFEKGAVAARLAPHEYRNNPNSLSGDSSTTSRSVGSSLSSASCWSLRAAVRPIGGGRRAVACSGTPSS